VSKSRHWLPMGPDGEGRGRPVRETGQEDQHLLGVQFPPQHVEFLPDPSPVLRQISCYQAFISIAVSAHQGPDVPSSSPSSRTSDHTGHPARSLSERVRAEAAHDRVVIEAIPTESAFRLLMRISARTGHGDRSYRSRCTIGQSVQGG